MPLQRERAELDGKQHRHLVRIGAQVVGGPRGAGRARQAAEPEDRRPLHGRLQAEPVHEPRIDGGRRDAGHGDEEEVIDVARRESGPRERVQHRLGAQLLRDLDEGVVRLLKGVEPGVGVERQGEVAPGHLHGAVQVLQTLDVEVLLGPQAAQRPDELLLVEVVPRQGAPDGADGGCDIVVQGVGLRELRLASWP